MPSPDRRLPRPGGDGGPAAVPRRGLDAGPELVAAARRAIETIDGSGHDLVHGTIVPEMDDFHTGALQDTAHDIDGGVMAVE